MKLIKLNEGWTIEHQEGVSALPHFSLDGWLASADPISALRNLARQPLSPANAHAAELPLESQEVWAAGVTYLRSKVARMDESDFSASAYDRVYDAPRPELFFKANARRCVGPGGVLRLRDDSKWMVPEPELVLVIAANRQIVGFTVGNDLSCRDIEGDNTLYLPQAKIWDKCCAIGPAILINDGAFDIRASTIRLDILRNGDVAFSGETPISRIKRPFEELVDYLFRNQTFPQGVFLFTGTGIVPPDEFTLLAGDEVRMSVPRIGLLQNRVH